MLAPTSRRVELKRAGAVLVFLLLLGGSRFGSAATQGQRVLIGTPETGMVSYLIVALAAKKGFFQQEGLQGGVIYLRSNIGIAALVSDEARGGPGYVDRKRQ